MKPTHPSPEVPELDATRGLDKLLLALLVLITLALYGGMSQHEFINFDDPIYITENPAVLGGLTTDGFAWALTSFEATNWHPLTWLSHMLDVSLFELDAGKHHRSGAFLHGLNAALCFLLLRSLLRSGARGGALSAKAISCIAFLGAAFFAWHPLRVESVAWLSERKDLLAACFWFLAVLSYLRYLRQPSLKSYLPLPVFLALSLASKPMAVSLPFFLLLLDAWPLGRTWSRRMLLEKLPLLVLVALSAWVTILAQGSGGAFDELRELGLSERLAGAFSAQATYLRQMFWPGELGFFYPHPGVLHPEGYVAWNATAWTGLGVFGALSCAAIMLRQRAPWIGLGWAWYLGMLVPVIGLVQVGGQAHADRYTYLPSIGIGLGLAAGLWCLLPRRGTLLTGIAGAALAFLLWLLPQSWAQVQTWKDSVSACEQSLAAAEDSYVGHNNLGQALEQRGEHQAAFNAYLAALKLRPEHLELQLNAAHALLNLGRWEPAERGLRNILAREPRFHGAQSDLGVLLAKQKRAAEALPLLNSAWGASELPLKQRASAGEALAWILATAQPTSLRDGPRAVAIMEECMQRSTGWLQWNTLAAALAQAGRFPEAAEAQARCLLQAPEAAQADLKRRLQSFQAGRLAD